MLGLALFVLTALAPSPSVPAEGPGLQLSSPALDFGSLTAGSTARLKLELQSNGDSALEIQNLGVNCECCKLRLSAPRRLNVPIDHANNGHVGLSLEPGQKASLSVTLDTSGLEPGTHQKECVIATNSPSGTIKVPLNLEVVAPSVPEHDHADHAGHAHERAPITAPAPTPTGPQPKISIETPTHNVGEVLRGEKPTHVFEFKNTGEAELVVQDVRSTCTCTLTRLWFGEEEVSGEQIVELRRDRKIGTVPPGGTAKVEVQIDTGKLSGARDGYPLRKSIRVMSNDTTQNPLVLNLEGTIVQAFQIEPRDLRFPVVRKGEPTSASVVISSDKVDDYNITGATTPVGGSLEARVTEFEEEGKRKFRIDVKILENADVGRIADNISLSIDHPKVESLQIPVYAEIRPQVAFFGNGREGTERLDFGVMDGGEDRTLSLRIENLNPDVPYVPKTVELIARTGKEWFQHEVEEVKPGVEYNIHVSIAKDIDVRFFNGKVRVESDHPDVPLKLIDFRGWVDRSKPEAGSEAEGS